MCACLRGCVCEGSLIQSGVPVLIKNQFLERQKGAMEGSSGAGWGGGLWALAPQTESPALALLQLTRWKMRANSSGADVTVVDEYTSLPSQARHYNWTSSTPHRLLFSRPIFWIILLPCAALF